jgi:hypothetical protein
LADNVIEFPGATQRVYKLVFTAPEGFKMTKLKSDDISLFLHATENKDFYGVAMVMASNRIQAQQKLSQVVAIKEWIESQ